MALCVSATALTDMGLRRENNEDQYVMSEPRRSIWWGAVCDGMGGMPGGEIASEITAATFQSGMKGLRREELASDRIVEIISQANARVLKRAEEEPALSGMGTTLSALAVDLAAARALLAQVGDSRIYRLRADHLACLTFDHNVAQDLVRTGVIDASRARLIPDANALTRVIGLEDFPGPEISVEEVLRGDLYLLCTDGLTNVLKEREVCALINTKDLELSVRQLVDATKARGAPDNVTMVLVRFD